MQETNQTLKEKIQTTTTALTPAVAIHSLCCGLPALAGAYAGKESVSLYKQQAIEHIIQAGQKTGMYKPTTHATHTTTPDQHHHVHPNTYESAHAIYHGLELTAMLAVGITAHKLNKKFGFVKQTKNYINALRSTNN